MNSTTSLPFTSFSMNCSIAIVGVLCARSPPARSAESCSDIYVAHGPRTAQSLKFPALGRVRHAGLQRQGVQFAAHLTLQRLIDQLVLLHPGFAAERRRNHGRRIVV